MWFQWEAPEWRLVLRAARIRIQHLIVNNDALSGVGYQRRWCGRHNRNGLNNRDEGPESQVDPYWPDVAKNHSGTKASNEFSRTFDSVKKSVFSRSLDNAEDRNTRIVRTSLRDEIPKLKQEPGKNILVGGVDVPSQLIELGLVDEYRFVVQPIVAGKGRRLPEGVSLPEKLQSKLVGSKSLESGCVALRYLKQ